MLRFASKARQGKIDLLELFTKMSGILLVRAYRRKSTIFFQTSILPAGWNHTQLSLLPKIEKPTRMTDMRPISLCSVQYNIISKILCNRLKLILPKIISETQGAFVSGRLISDNIIIAHEMVHNLYTNKKISKRMDGNQN